MVESLVEVQTNNFKEFIMNRLTVKEIYSIEESSFKTYYINRLSKIFEGSKLNN